MRRLLVAVLAGCYSPASVQPCAVSCDNGAASACPGNLVCMDQLCKAPNGTCSMPGDDSGTGDSSGAGDAMDHDGPDPGALCSVPTTFVTDSTVSTGISLAPRLGADQFTIRTVEFDDAGTTRLQVEGTRQMDFTGFGVIYSGTPTSKFAGATLDPSGHELFVRFEDSSATTSITLGRAVRQPNGSGVGQLRVVTLPSGFNMAGLDPSPPTTTMPRHMVLSKNLLFVELAETDPTGDTKWTVVRTTSQNNFLDPSSQPVAFLGQAHLTEEGRRLVFRGQLVGENVGVWYVERATIDDTFQGPARPLPHDTMLSARFPWFRSDCQQLVYGATDGSLHLVTY